MKSLRSAKYDVPLVASNCPENHSLSFFAEYWLPAYPLHIIKQGVITIEVKGKDTTPPVIGWVHVGNNTVQAKVFDGSKIQSVKAGLIAKDDPTKSFDVELKDDGKSGDRVEADNVFSKTIPEQIWGKWIVTRQIPTTTTSCWGAAEAKTLLGTEIEYFAGSFRWKHVVTTYPVAEARIVNAEQFHDDNSGKGSNSSQITFRELGIKANEVMLISIHHPPAKITGGTIEVPGDEVLLKDKDTIVFAACNVYFEAKRVSTKASVR